MSRAARNPLGIRQMEIIQAISEGLTKPEIAVRLFVSVDTVKTHRRRASLTLGLFRGCTDAGLVAEMFRRGLFHAPRHGRHAIPPMSPYAINVLIGVAEGIGNAEIAKRQGTTIDGIKYQVAHLLKQWNARNRAHLTYAAHMTGTLPWTPDDTPPTLPKLSPYRAALSPTEAAILARIADGESREEVASGLGMPLRTTGSRITNMNLKLGAANSAHAVAIGHCLGYFGTPHEGPPDPMLARPVVKLIEHVARGRNGTVIATTLGVHESTVERYLSAASTTLQATNRPNLVHRAFETGNLVVVRKAHA